MRRARLHPAVVRVLQAGREGVGLDRLPQIVARARWFSSKARMRSSARRSSGSNTEMPAYGPSWTRRGSAPMNSGVSTSRWSTTTAFRHRWWPSSCQPQAHPRRVAEERDEVRPLAERVPVSGELRQQLVQSHDRSGLVEPASGQGGTQQLQHKVALGMLQILEHDPVPVVVHVDVDPHPRWTHRSGRSPAGAAQVSAPEALPGQRL